LRLHGGGITMEIMSDRLMDALSGPGAALPPPLLAELGSPQLLALGLMAAGALVLRHALRPRKDRDELPAVKLPPSTPRPAEPSQEQLRLLISEARHLRGVLADETDRHAQRLEALIARAEQTIRRLEHLSNSDAAAARSLVRGDGVDPLNRRIYELADDGLPPVEIARQLNQQTGKVELVLALRPR
jgi:hypothetical protein